MLENPYIRTSSENLSERKELLFWGDGGFLKGGRTPCEQPEKSFVLKVPNESHYLR